MNPIVDILLTTGSSHIRHVDRIGARRMRIMTNAAVNDACRKAIAEGARPISMVDDLTCQKVGPWIYMFAKCLARSAKSVGISIIGGEMAQMPDNYPPGYIGIFVTVVSMRS